MTNENGAREYIKVVSDIIETEMNLKPSQAIGSTSVLNGTRVFIYNQDFIIPTYTYMFIVLSENPGKVVSNVNSYASAGALSNEVQEIIMQREILIDIFSKNSEARQRKEEVLMALSSVYSQQQQEANGMRIFSYSTRFIDVSEAEGAGMINRYQCAIMLHCRYSKTKAVNYYDTFEETLTVSG